MNAPRDPSWLSAGAQEKMHDVPALRNKFVDRFDTGSSRRYPAVNMLTGGIRKAAANDPHGINLWAGAGHRSASADPAVRIIEELASEL